MRHTALVIGLMLPACLAGAYADDKPAPAPQVLTLELEPVGKQAPPVYTPAEPDSPAAPEAAAKPRLRTIKAYYVGYADDSFEAVRRYVSFVDIVAGQWLSVDGAGRLSENDSGRNDDVRRIVHAAGKKVYTCVVNKGFSRGVLNSILNSADTRAAVADSIVAFVERKGDDGVDLDFEMLSRAQGDGYSAFVKLLANRLHARGKELSLAVDATWEGAPSPGFDYALLSQFADSIMPMTYTYGPGRAPIAPVDYLESAARIGTGAMDRGKFMIGMGVYARNYDLSAGRKTTPKVAAIEEIIARYHPDVALDPTTLTKKFVYQDDRGHDHVVFYDDAETIRAKLDRLYTRYGVTAVGFWRMGQENGSLWPTLQAATGRQNPEQTASAGAPAAGPAD